MQRGPCGRGNNYWGQLGDGETTTYEVVTPATPVAGGLKFRSIHLVRSFTCGLAVDWRTYCWGMVFGGETVGDVPHMSMRPMPVLLIP